jgi:hypothetical protein
LRLAFLDRDASLKCAKKVGQILKAELKWNTDELEADERATHALLHDDNFSLPR